MNINNCCENASSDGVVDIGEDSTNDVDDEEDTKVVVVASLDVASGVEVLELEAAVVVAPVSANKRSKASLTRKGSLLSGRSTKSFMSE